MTGLLRLTKVLDDSREREIYISVDQIVGFQELADEGNPSKMKTYLITNNPSQDRWLRVKEPLSEVIQRSEARIL
jgi:hypothetical protein